MLLGKFATVELGVKVKLFNILRLSSYGLELIHDQTSFSNFVRKLVLSHRYELKRLIGFTICISAATIHVMFLIC